MITLNLSQITSKGIGNARGDNSSCGLDSNIMFFNWCGFKKSKGIRDEGQKEGRNSC